MADYDVTLSQTLLPALLSGQDGLAKLLQSALNQVLEAQMTEHIGAERYERAEERDGRYRNGHRERQLYTRVGPISLRIPQTRDGSFSTEIFERYQRSERAFVLGLMEMYVTGTSTRKVTKITEELCGVSFSKSTVSRLCAGLDEAVEPFLKRDLEPYYPFVIVDAMFTKSRTNGQVVSKALLIASAVRPDGYREPIGFAVGDSESYATWDALFKNLKERKLERVDFVISDNHSGLKKAAMKHFSGATWQRCQVHLQRNIGDHSPRKEREAINAATKLVLYAADRDEAIRRRDDFVERFSKTAPKAVACLEEAFDDAIAVLCLPEKYRKRLRSTNMQERLNEEIRRRERVLRIFPNDAAAKRLVGALLIDAFETWQERRYLDMAEYHEWRERQDRKAPISTRKAA
ncbi:MAG: IS256 family transposase [Vulcanimicrobiaceae bacterium]